MAQGHKGLVWLHSYRLAQILIEHVWPKLQDIHIDTDLGVQMYVIHVFVHVAKQEIVYTEWYNVEKLEF